MIERDDIQLISLIVVADIDNIENLVQSILVNGCEANGYTISSIDVSKLPEAQGGCYIIQNES